MNTAFYTSVSLFHINGFFTFHSLNLSLLVSVAFLRIPPGISHFLLTPVKLQLVTGFKSLSRKD